MIVITGTNGFIAKHLFNKLKDENEIICTSKEESKDIINILKVNKPDYIYHLGAEIYDNDIYNFGTKLKHSPS